MSKDRHHHYVAAFHLAHFTRTGSQEGRFSVFDLHKQATWKTTPKGAGNERDFYRVDAEGIDPLAIEKDFLNNSIETPGAIAFKAILDAARGTANAGMTSAFVDHNQLYALLRFVAVQKVRGPDQRAMNDDLHTDLANGLLQAIAKNDALFEQRKGESPVPLGDMTREQFQEAVDENPVRAEVGRTSQIQSAMQLVRTVLANLITRAWKVCLSPPGAPSLVCTDRPVVILPPPNLPPGMPYYGLATPGAMVLMPLSRTAVLIGTSLVPPSDERISVEYMPAGDVAELNTLICASAHRYVYCADENIVHVDERGRIGGTKELFESAATTMRERERRASMPRKSGRR